MGGGISIADKDGPGTLIRFHVSFDAPSSDAPKAFEAVRGHSLPPSASLSQGAQVLLAMPEGLGRGIAER